MKCMIFQTRSKSVFVFLLHSPPQLFRSHRVSGRFPDNDTSPSLPPAPAVRLSCSWNLPLPASAESSVRYRKVSQHTQVFPHELDPAGPLDSGNSQRTDQTSGSRNDQIGKCISQLESKYRSLTGNSQQICQRSHDWHRDCCLSGSGYHKEIKYGLKQIHQHSCCRTGKSCQCFRDSIPDIPSALFFSRSFVSSQIAAFFRESSTIASSSLFLRIPWVLGP